MARSRRVLPTVLRSGILFTCTTLALCLTGLTGTGTLAKAQTASEQKECSLFPSESLPVIEWCVSDDTFTYTIRTWGETTELSRKKTIRSITSTLKKWLANECRTTSLRTRTARIELWLAVPWSGAELAQPRIGLALDDGNIVFANAWSEPWRAESKNMHILGDRNYEDYSGTSQSGVAPDEILFKARQTDDLVETASPLAPAAGTEDDNLLLSPEARSLLQRYGIKPTEIVSSNLGIAKGSVSRYRELQAVEDLSRDPEFPQPFSWVEPLFRIEHIADNFLLYSDDLKIWQIPSACLWR